MILHWWRTGNDHAGNKNSEWLCGVWKIKGKKKQKVQGMFLRRWKTQTLMLDIEAGRSPALEQWLFVESSLEPQGLRPDWEIMVYGAPWPSAWRVNNRWTMENKCGLFMRAEDWLTISLFVLYGTFLGWQNHLFYDEDIRHFGVKFLSNYVSHHWWSLSSSCLQDLQNRQNPVRWQYNSRNAFFPKEKW